ncbi:antibiotic biosynthesis monooxygenase family protein [Pseudonocardia sichuanensis]|uniref:Heme-degrading monooxygenase HmoA n=1 Tax=Pseudonocardia kunmingensis TaxID=630975 RepID=A0A543DW34_9PSEU|nr:antibiotic biosynthesis monooxygenase family protein [Pseudonocardia kunmingensis]TQM13536.1 heme-degrading monooxygenase HmoA [Pseudonocardia kunmingensis]
MVLEIAEITVLPGTSDEFAAAVREGIRYVADTPGFRTARLTRCIETPGRFVLLVEWDSVEAHTVGFRESENFERWRGHIGPFLDGQPRVEHFDDVALPGPAGG